MEFEDSDVPSALPDSPPAGRKNRSDSFDFAASPQNQTQKIVSSLLPQAKHALVALSQALALEQFGTQIAIATVYPVIFYAERSS